MPVLSQRYWKASLIKNCQELTLNKTGACIQIKGFSKATYASSYVLFAMATLFILSPIFLKWVNKILKSRHMHHFKRISSSFKKLHTCVLITVLVNITSEIRTSEVAEELEKLFFLGQCTYAEKWNATLKWNI